MDKELKSIQLKELNREAIIYENLDDAFIGIQEKDDRFVAVYDIHKLFNIFINQGLDMDDARDHVYKSIVHVYLGENTPVFIYMFEE